MSTLERLWDSYWVHVLFGFLISIPAGYVAAVFDLDVRNSMQNAFVIYLVGVVWDRTK